MIIDVAMNFQKIKCVNRSTAAPVVDYTITGNNADGNHNLDTISLSFGATFTF